MDGLDRSAKILRKGGVSESGWIQINKHVGLLLLTRQQWSVRCYYSTSYPSTTWTYILQVETQKGSPHKRLMRWHYTFWWVISMRSTSDERSWGAHKRPLGNPADFLSKLRVGPMVPWCNTTISGRKFMGLHGAWREHPAEVLGHLRSAFRDFDSAILLPWERCEKNMLPGWRRWGVAM